MTVIKNAIPDAFKKNSSESAADAENHADSLHGLTAVERPEFRGDVSYGALKLSSRYMLSPLAGFTTLSFRRIVRNIGGVGLATTDLVNCRLVVRQRTHVADD